MIVSLLFVCALCLANYEHASAQIASPCPQVFRYDLEIPRGNDRWYGTLRLACHYQKTEIQLNVILEKQAVDLKIFAKNVTTADNMNFLITNPELEEGTNETCITRFHVKYKSNEQIIPRLLNVKLNGEEICILRRKTRQSKKEYCGLSPTNIPGPLITQGTVANIQQYPWHAAIYKLEGSLTSSYICGGSLVTKKHVLTAAHCAVRASNSVQPRDPRSLITYLGLQNRRRIASSSVQDMDVSKITIHPEFTTKNYSNDIAILQLVSEITITDFVRPICLWEGAGGTENDALGSVAGWGIDESFQLSEELKHAKLPLVSDGVCFRSNVEFFGSYLSPNSFCAGYKNGTSVCNGDSGGGMVFPKEKISQFTVWQLRGIISLAAQDADTTQCDVHQYVIFTDVAKYLPWIRNSIGGTVLDAFKPPTKQCGVCGSSLQKVSKRSIFEHIVKRSVPDTCCSRRTTHNGKDMWDIIISRNQDVVPRIRNLLCAGEDPNTRFNDVPNGANFGVTPLMQAAYEANLDAMKVLLEYGADVNLVSTQGYSAIILASFSPLSAVPKLLIENGAYVHQVNKYGKTALSFAILHNFTETEKLLREAGATA